MWLGEDLVLIDTKVVGNEPTKPMSGASLAVIAGIWGVMVAVVSAIGLLSQQPPAMAASTILAGVLVPVLIYFRHAPFYALMNEIGPHRIAWLHLIRIPAAVALFVYGANAWLPEAFVARAGWGDLIAGLFALAIVILAHRFWTTAAFHVVGLTDLVLAVGTGLMLNLQQDPLIATLTRFPMALIPWWLVGVTGATHLMALDMLWRQRRSMREISA